MAKAIFDKVTVELERHEVFGLVQQAYADLGQRVTEYEDKGEAFRFMIDIKREKVKFWENVLARMDENS